VSKVVRWGVLGAARIAASHVIPALLQAERCGVAALASRSIAQAQDLSSRLGLSIPCCSYDDLLARSDVDAVYIALPNSLHAEWTEKAVLAGKAVLCEKPLATSSAEASRVEKVAQDAQRLVVEGFMYRHHPQFARVMEITHRQELGRVVTLRGSINFLLGTNNDIRARLELGGGAILDVGCYPTDAFRLLVGTPAASARAYARTSPTGVDELAACIYVFPEGELGVLDCGFVAPWLTAPLEILFEGGLCRLENAYNPGLHPTSLIVQAAGGRPETTTFPGVNMYQLLAEAFTASLLDGVPFPYPLRGSVETAGMLDTLRESTR